MRNSDQLVGNSKHDNTIYCLAKQGELYLVYLLVQKKRGAIELDLGAAKGNFSVKWFNPRLGGELKTGTIQQVVGGRVVEIGHPPADVSKDWLAVIRGN